MSQLNKTAHELAEDYYLRELDTAELDFLQESMLADPELRQQFAENARDEWLLHHIHADMDSQYVKEPTIARFPPKRISLARLSGIAAALALSLTGLFLYQESQPQQATSVTAIPEVAPIELASITAFYKINGDTISLQRNGESYALTKLDRLLDGDTVELPRGARLRFQYLGENTTVSLQGGSKFTLKDSDGAKHIQLLQGQLHAKVAPQPDGKPMRILTDDAEAVVLGTVFEIQRQAYTQLSVLKGKVGFNSRDKLKAVEVLTGHLANSDQVGAWHAHPFQIKRSQPIFDHTLNKKNHPEFIAVDSKRNFIGFLRFDCGDLNGAPIEAKLRLRVEQHMQDSGGSGTVRLYQVPPATHIYNAQQAPMVEVASYTGKLAAGMNLEFEIDAESIQSGINTYVIKLDKKGNDFWFSSSEGKVPPQLTLKVATPGI